MTSPLINAQRLSDEAAKWRRLYRDAVRVLEEQNRMLLDVYLRSRLADPSDFTDRYTVDRVVGRDHRINWAHTTALVDELLAQKPHLNAPNENPWPAGERAITWFTSGTG